MPRGLTDILTCCWRSRSAPPCPAPPRRRRPQTLQQRVEARLREAGPGTRFGLVVATEDGRELVAIAPDARFIPASNTKMFTTAAAFATLPGLDRPDAAGGAAVRLETARRGRARRGPRRPWRRAPVQRARTASPTASPRSPTPSPRGRARSATSIGDDSLFPDQRWSPGMSWNNIPTRSGTAVSALSLDDNELPSAGRAGARRAGRRRSISCLITRSTIAR